ncbi:MAG: Fe-S cluster assembly protein SufD [Chloroflexi bacterium]|nr:Fe-S cluster assembly protein SufD [Chloroflexota bacterium]
MARQTVTPEAQKERYLRAFDSLELNGATQDPSWVRALRKAAIARFKELGFPTTRRGNEEWKYTDVRPVAEAAFQILVPSAPARLGASEVERFTFGEAGWPRLVFVDGVYIGGLSSVPALSGGVRVLSLAKAMAMQDGLVEQHLGRYADYESNAFTALNTAFIHDGAFVHIPDGAILGEPIHLLFLYTAGDQEPVSHPRVLIVAGERSQATVVESHGGLSEGRYFANVVSEIVVGAGATLRYRKVQRQSDPAFHITTTQVALDRDGTFSSMNVDIGGGLVRNNLNLLMGGEGCSCTLDGVYLITGAQHVDNQVIIDHAKPYTTSRELYKGILGGRARSVFHGSIIVRKDARKVNAYQVDKNLLLSNEAEADTKPAFWIYCDDVKCGHGAACGQLDEKMLFYLRSRGIDEEEARKILIRAFVTEVIDSVKDEPLHAYIDELAMAKLQSM